MMEKPPYTVSTTSVGFHTLQESDGPKVPNEESPAIVKAGLNTKKFAIIIGSVVAVGVIAAVGVGVGVAVLNKDKDATQPSDGTPPPPVQDPINGAWTYWDKWSDCSVTCGGGMQTRRRTCSAPPPLFGGRQCDGKNLQTRACADWDCPDCSRKCPNGGSLSTGCDLCLCPQEVLFGTVRDINNMPIHDVDVYVSYKQWESVATTNYWGEYRVHSVCNADTKLVFKKEGYMQNETLPVSVNLTFHQANAYLRKFETPVIEKQPVNKYRFVGQSASLCCTASGFPAAIQYSWFRNDTRISHGMSTGILRLTNLQRSDQGSYTCTAESVAGIVKSETVQVIVKDPSRDTCDRNPRPKMEKLPAGCMAIVNGAQTNEIDIGQCAQLPCITSSDVDNGTCEEWWPSKCCDVEAVDRIQVTCKDFSYTLNRIKECSCSLGSIVTHITVFAYGIKNGTRVPYQRGKVFIDGSHMVYSSSTGMVVFTTPFEKTAVTLSFQEDIRGEFLDAIKTLKISPGKEMTAHIILPLRPIPITFNTRMGLSIPLNNLQGVDRVATVSIPSDSILDKDGNKFEGNANALVNFMDPRKIEDLQSADGEFSTIDDNGNLSPLETFGMFRMHFEDSAGSELYLSGPITTQMDASLFNISQDKDGDPEISMWHLDPNTGKWVKQGAFRYVQNNGKRRLLQNGGQMIEGIINPSSIPEIKMRKSVTTYKVRSRPIYSNCDHSVVVGHTYSRYTQLESKVKADACVVKVKTYTDFSLSQPLKGVIVTAATKELNGPRFKGINSATSDVNGNACLNIFCNSEVYLFTAYSTQMYASDRHSLPTNYGFNNTQNLTHVKFQSLDPYINQVRNDKLYSPVYDYFQKGHCEDNSFSNGAFQFAPIKKENKLDPFLGKLTIYNKRQAWYTKPVGNPQHRSCFIKVNVKSQLDNLNIIAKSIIGDNPSKHDEYGTYSTSPYWDESTGQRYSKAACIEFRCAGLVVDGTSITRNVPTTVLVKVTSQDGVNCTMYHNAVNVTSLGFSTFKFTADPTDLYGEMYGVFIRPRDSGYMRKMCESGTLSGSGTTSTMKPDKNPAFSLTCVSE